MFSKACEYAIRATVFIASEYKNEDKVGIEDICNNIEAPRPFTAKILQILARENILSSKKGVHGGFYMDEQQGNIKLIDVVYAIDGESLFTSCALGLNKCSEKAPCPLHNKFKPIREGLKKVLESTTIKEMAKKIEKGSSVLKI